jgi:hypothetical protein
MTTAEKNALISLQILANVQGGKSLKEAIDAVLGAGRYDAIVSDLYDALRAQAQKA